MSTCVKWESSAVQSCHPADSNYIRIMSRTDSVENNSLCTSLLIPPYPWLNWTHSTASTASHSINSHKAFTVCIRTLQYIFHQTHLLRNGRFYGLNLYVYTCLKDMNYKYIICINYKYIKIYKCILYTNGKILRFNCVIFSKNQFDFLKNFIN